MNSNITSEEAKLSKGLYFCLVDPYGSTEYAPVSAQWSDDAIRHLLLKSGLVQITQAKQIIRSALNISLGIHTDTKKIFVPVKGFKEKRISFLKFKKRWISKAQKLKDNILDTLGLCSVPNPDWIPNSKNSSKYCSVPRDSRDIRYLKYDLISRHTSGGPIIPIGDIPLLAGVVQLIKHISRDKDIGTADYSADFDALKDSLEKYKKSIDEDNLIPWTAMETFSPEPGVCWFGTKKFYNYDLVKAMKLDDIETMRYRIISMSVSERDIYVSNLIGKKITHTGYAIPAVRYMHQHRRFNFNSVVSFCILFILRDVPEYQSDLNPFRKRKDLTLFDKITSIIHLYRCFVDVFYCMESANRIPIIRLQDVFYGTPGTSEIADLSRKIFDYLSYAFGRTAWDEIHNRGLELTFSSSKLNDLICDVGHNQVKDLYLELNKCLPRKD